MEFSNVYVLVDTSVTQVNLQLSNLYVAAKYFNKYIPQAHTPFPFRENLYSEEWQHSYHWPYIHDSEENNC